MNKQKYYQVIELNAVGEIVTFERSVFKTKKEAIQFIHDFEEDFYRLVIWEVYE